MSAEELARYCIVHMGWTCDLSGNCEYLPKPGSFEYRISAGSAIAWRNLHDGSYICVYVMGANYRLCVGSGQSINRAWCYDRSKADNIRKALTDWDGNGMPPDGWHRDLQTGMRRTNGDPKQEYFNP